MLKKRTLSLMLVLMVVITSVVGFSTTALAAGPFEEYEDANGIFNDTPQTARLLTVTNMLSKTTYTHVHGNFYDVADTEDWYKFTVYTNSGSNGRISLKLEGIPAGHNYDMILYDSNQTIVQYNGAPQSSTRTGNSNEIVRTPKITASTLYYLKIVPVTVPSYAASNYRIVFDENIATSTKNVSFSPIHLTSTSNVWSADLVADCRTIVSDAVITAATIQADKSSVANTISQQLRAKMGANGAYAQVAWKSGAISLPGLVGQNASNYWYVGFMATEIQVLVAGRLTYLGIVQMDNFKLNVTYEYDKFLNY